MNITDAIFDPELGCTAFTVERITYTRSRSGTTSRSTTARAMGCIHPGTPIYTDYALSTGTPESTGASFMGPDRIHWNNQTWRVVRVRDWQMFGYYQAYAVRMITDP